MKKSRAISAGRSVAKPDKQAVGNPDKSALGWSFGYVFREANRAFSDTFRIQLRSYGITLGQWFFLRELWDEEGLSQRELSRRVGVREPTTATALEIMEKRGLILRRRKQRDHRSQFVHLTHKGRALRDRLLSLAIKVNERALGDLSDHDANDLRAKIMTMIANLAPPADADEGE
jgi:DNA-binding MarR family transcriptional regulator